MNKNNHKTKQNSNSNRIWTIASLNAQGKLNKNIDQIIEYFTEESIDLLMIQDCGSTTPSKRKLNAFELTLQQHIQKQNDPAGNLAVMYKKELEQELVIQPSDNNRIMTITINNKYQLINVYVQKYNKEFTDTLISLQKIKPTLLIGDFNSYDNPNLDRTRHLQHEKSTS